MTKDEAIRATSFDEDTLILLALKTAMRHLEVFKDIRDGSRPLLQDMRKLYDAFRAIYIDRTGKEG